MTNINRDFFFDHLHATLYSAGLNQSQFDGHNAVLDMWQANHADEDDRWLAYMFATAYHETAHTLQPVRETLAPTDEKAAALLESAWAKGKLPWVSTPYWRRDGDGRHWFGRGLVQLTHKDNYAKMARETGEALDVNPELALQMPVAIEIMASGMFKGMFTGRKLADYFHRSTADWVGARRIVNGLDRARDIAGYGKSYYAAISYAT